MDQQSIVKVLEQLKAKNIVRYGENVMCSCAVARWKHPKGFDNRPSMGISINDRDISLVNCLACGYRGTLETLVSDISGWGNQDLSKLIEWVSDRDKVDPEYLVDQIQNYDEYSDTDFEEKVFSKNLIKHMMRLAHPYIIRRGISTETLEAWSIGFDKEQKRVVFPVLNRKQELVGMVGRGIASSIKPKYINYWKFEKGAYLLGEHQFTSEPKPTVIVEGPIDALYVWQAASKPKPVVVALMGAKITPRQLEKLERHASSVTLLLDNDEAGDEGRALLRKRLRDKVMVLEAQYPVDEPRGGDPSQAISLDSMDKNMRSPIQLRTMISDSVVFY